MDEKEIILAEKILDRLGTMKTNVSNVQEKAERIERVLLGPPQLKDTEDSEVIMPAGLLNEIFYRITEINEVTIDTMKTATNILNEIEIKTGS